MKIGILTYHFSVNYGAVLQTYALKTFLEMQGHEVEVLNYNTSIRYRKNRPLGARIVSMVWSPVRLVLGGSKKDRVFNRFRRNKLDVQSNEIQSKNELEAYCKKSSFDALIVGSDQVWNPVLNGHDTSYYLDLDGRFLRISYAASFGVPEVDEDDRKTIINALQAFDAISVREKTGLQILDVIRDCVEVVLDPVFLLNPSHWRELETSVKTKQKYILCYILPGDKVLEQKIESFAKEYRKVTGYDVVYLGRKEYKQFLPDGKDFVAASPEEFVYLIDHAEVVITNSFHGTAFSVLFQKKLYSFVNSNQKKEKKLASRLVDLLTELRLTESFVYPDDKPDVRRESNYSEVDLVLRDRIKDSRDFLTTALLDRNRG